MGPSPCMFTCQAVTSSSASDDWRHADFFRVSLQCYSKEIEKDRDEPAVPNGSLLVPEYVSPVLSRLSTRKLDNTVSPWLYQQYNRHFRTRHVVFRPFAGRLIDSLNHFARSWRRIAKTTPHFDRACLAEWGLHWLKTRIMPPSRFLSFRTKKINLFIKLTLSIVGYTKGRAN